MRVLKVLTVVLFTLVISLAFIQTSKADWTIAFEGSYDYDYGYGSRMSREVRNGTDLDDWLERGSSSVTASPIFPDGVRLSAWATATDDKYDFALASAVYLFDIPKNSRYIKIKVRYQGEGREPDLEGYDDVSGRVWVKNYEQRRTKYFDDDDDEDTRYGDTFVLRAKRRSETIRIPASNHLDDGILEVHIAAEGNDRVDVESIEVESYERSPEIRVIRRYDRDYYWRPWRHYTYNYFYDGPSYYFTDYDYYISWSFPRYDHEYVEIRRHYRDYLYSYYEIYPHQHVHVYEDVYNDRPRALSNWTTEHEKLRRLYDRSRVEKRPRNEYYQVDADVRAQVTTTLEKQRQSPVVSERTSKRTYQKRSRESSANEAGDVRPTIRSRSRGDSIDRTTIENNPSLRSGSDSDKSNREEIIKRRRYDDYRTSPTSPSYQPQTETQAVERSVEKRRRDSESSSSQSSQSSVQKARSSSVSPSTTSSSSTSSSSASEDDDEEKKKRSSSSGDSTRSSTRERTKKRRE